MIVVLFPHMKEKNTILADGRWSGPHGIGRFSDEVLPRLQNTSIMTDGPKPLSSKNFYWLPYQLQKKKRQHELFFTPGFNPVLFSPIPFVFIIHDLCHIHAPGTAKFAKQVYYQTIMKKSALAAHKILTPSEYSKQTILEWANIPEDKIIVVGSGINEKLTPHGDIHLPGYKYLLHVGNTKAHKNVESLVRAFAMARIDESIRLVLTGTLTPEIAEAITIHHLKDRVIFTGVLTEKQLAEYYRGATAVVFPSLYEGFGLPIVEGMACGIPVLTSNITSMPEVAGDAAVLVNPYRVESIANGIEKIVNDSDLRKSLIEKGLERAKLFSWEKTAEKVQNALILEL